jgi:uncharacterized protein YqiB (DUF1249 family)
MLLDFTPVRQGRDVNARSFAGLMELYEQNYIRLRNIAPDLCVADEMISSVPAHQDLYLSINERCKYTTMLRMTYQFEEDGQPLFEPDLHLKVYHDAHVVEVQQFHSRTRGPLYVMARLLFVPGTLFSSNAAFEDKFYLTLDSSFKLLI